MIETAMMPAYSIDIFVIIGKITWTQFPPLPSFRWVSLSLKCVKTEQNEES
jgi:hypothetical protein